jgi:nuclease-like protein
MLSLRSRHCAYQPIAMTMHTARGSIADKIGRYFSGTSRLSDRRRSALLSSRGRTGAQSRRQVRSMERDWLRDHWTVLVGFLLGVSAMAAAVIWLAPPWLAPFVAGAMVASASWWVYVLMLETGGIANKRAGITAEEQTAAELRRLRSRGWRTINHVMLAKGDVDHAVLGPGGFFAVETKFKTDWSQAERDFGQWTRSAQASARGLGSRIAPKERRVRPLVVLCGPSVRDRYPVPFERDGVTFCPAGHLLAFLRAEPLEVDESEVRAAFDTLAGYVDHLDAHETATSGPLPRVATESINDVAAITVAFVVTALAVLAPSRIPPSGMWCVATALVALAAGFWVRHLRPQGVRIIRVTTTVITTAAGLGGLVLLAVVAVAIG